MSENSIFEIFMYTLYKKIETWLEGICEDCVKNEIKNFDGFALINPEKHYTNA